jgi:hypothetical protein
MKPLIPQSISRRIERTPVPVQDDDPAYFGDQPEVSPEDVPEYYQAVAQSQQSETIGTESLDLPTRLSIGTGTGGRGVDLSNRDLIAAHINDYHDDLYENLRALMPAKGQGVQTPFTASRPLHIILSIGLGIFHQDDHAQASARHFEQFKRVVVFKRVLDDAGDESVRIMTDIAPVEIFVYKRDPRWPGTTYTAQIKSLGQRSGRYAMRDRIVSQLVHFNSGDELCRRIDLLRRETIQDVDGIRRHYINMVKSYRVDLIASGKLPSSDIEHEDVLFRRGSFSGKRELEIASAKDLPTNAEREVIWLERTDDR